MSYSEEILARYKQVERAADAFGRLISVKRLNPAQQLKLMEMTDSNSDAVRTMLFAAASVCQIDDAMASFPKNRGELDAMIARLDQEGLTAAGEALRKLHGANEGEQPADALETAKNS